MDRKVTTAVVLALCALFLAAPLVDAAAGAPDGGTSNSASGGNGNGGNGGHNNPVPNGATPQPN